MTGVAARSVVMAAVLAAMGGGLSLAGCGGSQSVAGWVSSNQLGAWIGTLQSDDSRIDRVLSDHRGAKAVYSDCALLIADVSNSPAGSLPTPDGQLTTDLDRAFRAEEAAGDDCARASAGGPLLAQSARERQRARVLFAAALERVAALTGRTPPTTTSPGGPPGSGS